jgi:hypothetical protein
MREEETDAPGTQQRHKTPRRRTAPTSRKGEDAPQSQQVELRYGDREVDGRIFHPTTGIGRRVTVEVSAPAEEEEATGGLCAGATGAQVTSGRSSPVRRKC